jgi:hypothetical protein
MSRSWVFTLNNYTEEEFRVVQEDWECRFLVVGKEVGEEGTPHLQGYIVFPCIKRITGMKKLSGRAHWEQAKGDADSNVAYCSKEGDVFTRGDKPVSQKRKGEMNVERYERAWKAARIGDLEAIDADIRFSHYRTCKEIGKDFMIKPDDASETTGLWYYGEAGSGKSRTARAEFPDSYLKMANKWWDGYQAHPTVILDDFGRDHKVLGHHLKIWSDRYSFLAETKGGAIHIRPEVLCVTSQYSIEEIWSEDLETQAALKRRFKCKHFSVL